jgi:tRNA-Thr(GGU) m(6)t(6)A37 methyltransferase TsaA
VLLYHFHASDGGFSLRVEPFLDDTDRGVFATRAPRRPNPIGISTVEVVSVEGARLTVDGIDVVDGTPLLDVKPFVGGFGVPENSDDGWLEDASGDAESRRADDRFQ